MQCQPRPARRKRALYYTAAMYVGQLTRGADYRQLMPVHGIWIVDFEELSSGRFHSVFRLLEVHEHEEFTNDFELHWIELPRLAQAIDAGDEPRLANWCRFFNAASDEELEYLAMTEPDIRKAKEALEDLSADPDARTLAAERCRALHFYREDIDMAREEGLRRGRVEAIEALCEAFDVPLDEPRRRQLGEAEVNALDTLLAHLRTNRTWPSG